MADHEHISEYISEDASKKVIVFLTPEKNAYLVNHYVNGVYEFSDVFRNRPLQDVENHVEDWFKDAA